MVKVKENDRQRHVVFLVSYRLRNTACTAKDTIAVATVTAAVIFAVVISSSFVGFAFAAMSNVFATAGTNTSLRKDSVFIFTPPIYTISSRVTRIRTKVYIIIGLFP